MGTKIQKFSILDRLELQIFNISLIVKSDNVLKIGKGSNNLNGIGNRLKLLLKATILARH